MTIVLTSIGATPEGNAEGVKNYTWTELPIKIPIGHSCL